MNWYSHPLKSVFSADVFVLRSMGNELVQSSP